MGARVPLLLHVMCGGRGTIRHVRALSRAPYAWQVTWRRIHRGGNRESKDGWQAAYPAITAATLLSTQSGVECNDDSSAKWMSRQGEHAWLEQVEGEEALKWVRARNDETLRALGDPRESETYLKVLACLESKDKIPAVRKIGSSFYNYWTDSKNARGVLRRVATLESYASEQPAWETVLDVDTLAAAEQQKWVWKGQAVLREYDELTNEPLPIEPDRSLIALSPGGSDAVVRREFDLKARQFVETNAFHMPEPAKSQVSWLDRDTLLVGVGLREGDLTTSGYPRVVREWKRGTKLEDAPVVFEGEASDVTCGASVTRSRREAFEWRYRAVSFYSFKRSVRRHTPRRDQVWYRLDQLGIPDDVDVSVFGSDFLLELRSTWNGFKAGSLVAVDFDDLTKRGPAAEYTVLFEPDARTSLVGYAKSKDFVILNVLESVKSRLIFLEKNTETTPARAGWEVANREVEASIRAASVVPVDSDDSNDYFLTTSSYLTPPTLRLSSPKDDPTKVGRVLKSLPALFQAPQHNVTQQFATSADGTKVPYFIVTKGDPTMPCLLYGYGGFEISVTPSYSSIIGSGWLQRGGTYVVANIRGGGEFGPNWHKAALRENRQKAFDDFHAVAAHLVSTGIVDSAHRIGIRGGSNGGLLVANCYVQRPDLYGAVVCAVPLIDMKRFSHLLAGASWREEYGDPDTSDWDRFLKRYSPYHQLDLANNNYPPILLTTSTKDDRVHPYHARAFVHRLQDNSVPGVYYYENIEGGHGGASTPAQTAYVSALYQDFLFDVLQRPKKGE